MGRAAALVELTGDWINFHQLKVYSQNLGGPLRETNAQAIATIVYEAHAKAELNAPAAVRGTFIAAGHTFDAFAAVGNILKTAQTDILFVDAYADETVLFDYAVLAPENVTVRVLAEAYYKQSLKPPPRDGDSSSGTVICSFASHPTRRSTIGKFSLMEIKHGAWGSRSKTSPRDRSLH